MFRRVSQESKRRIPNNIEKTFPVLQKNLIVNRFTGTITPDNTKLNTKSQKL